MCQKKKFTMVLLIKPMYNTWEVKANCHHFHGQLRRKPFRCFRQRRNAENAVRSYRYTVLTFLPLNLYEQFQRFANIFFLLVVILQCVPAIATIPWYTTLLPLIIVLSVRGMKDLSADLARRRSDSQINSRPCDVLTPAGFTTLQWKDVCIGDVLRIHKDQIIPADLLLLCSSEPHSLCYVETADIDGETNLKYRQALSITHSELISDPAEEALSTFDGNVLCENPNNRLYSFKGDLYWRGKTHRLDIEHILLRGMVLRNTDCAYGLAIYTGSDCKILRNSGQVIVKKTQVEKDFNRVVIGIVLTLLLVAVLMAVGSGLFEYRVSPKMEVLSALGGGSTPVYRGFLAFWGYVILLSPSMPIALYITFEMIHVVHCLLIGWDLHMYWANNDTPAQARSKSLNEELGQVGHLLSDKTGTLTQNRLIFRQCCIAGDIYGLLPHQKLPLDLSWNPYSYGGLHFHDQRLVDRLVKQQCPQSQEFLTSLVLCHTVMSDTTFFAGTIRYQAASPDEEALVVAARELGWVFLSRTRDSLTINALGQTLNYELLALLDFTSDRRRMSVLVREPGGGLKLYCKGADVVILERLQKDSPHQESTARALEIFAQGCLRTLCVAVRTVTEQQWQKWRDGLQEGEALVEELHGRMERELMLLGVTAIEDRLQDGVPEAISSLRQAGIKVWVLTGDKTETAVNVGYSCRLIDPDTNLLQGEDFKDLDVWCIDNRPPWSKVTVVITGHQLADLMEEPEWGARFVALSNQCQSVLCCRVTPGQKAEVVRLIRKHTSSVTLAIGDGANDVNMIKTAHIGVGLCGVEGSQAVQNADFALSQFSFLCRLLLVHGHWSYYRICKFLHYFLFKTTAFALVHIWFGFFSGFSAQPLYETWFIPFYTIAYTSMPVQCLAIFEQDVSAEGCLRWAALYKTGQRRDLFSPATLAASLLYSVYTSLVLCLLPLGAFHSTALDYQTLAITVATSAVFTVTIEIIIQTRYWTKYNIAAICLSLALYFILTLIVHSKILHDKLPADFYFTGTSLNPVVWLTILLTTSFLFLLAVHCAERKMFQLAFLLLIFLQVHSMMLPTQVRRPGGFRRGGVLRHSSYAMSQGAGFGRLITSGTGLHATAPAQEGAEAAANGTKENNDKL
uniref:Phospholipid-transporting ATPase n=1 Tax=Denticeps clupeoides TaxID=299321 RepID=A0AAY4D161_9TELE